MIVMLLVRKILGLSEELLNETILFWVNIHDNFFLHANNMYNISGISEQQTSIIEKNTYLCFEYISFVILLNLSLFYPKILATNAS